MDEIGSYVACIGLPMGEIWYQRFVSRIEEATTCPCGFSSFPNLVPLTWPTRLLHPTAHVKSSLTLYIPGSFCGEWCFSMLHF
jgi:hypothetical protein